MNGVSILIIVIVVIFLVILLRQQIIISSEEQKYKIIYIKDENHDQTKSSSKESRIENPNPDIITNEPPPQPSIPGAMPVPRGALKLSSEKYKAPFYTSLPGYEFISNIASQFTPEYNKSFPTQNRPLNGYDYFKPYGPNPPPEKIDKEARYADIPFYSSVDAYAPIPEINTQWEKMGIVTTVNETDDSIMNLYRRPIAPLQDLWEYSVQDKNGFVLKLRNTSYLEDGDVIPYVEGKQNKGPWKVTDYIKNKYVLM